MAEGEVPTAPEAEVITEPVPRVIDTLDREGLMQEEGQGDKGDKAENFTLSVA